MKFREIQSFTRCTLKKRYAATLTAALLYPALWLLLKLMPCFLAAVLIACDVMTPRALFLGGLPQWVVFTVLWELLAFGILTPVKCGVCSWMTDMLGFSGGGENCFFRSPGAYIRGILFFAGTALCRMLMLVPFVLSAGAAVLCFQQSLSEADGGWCLFLAAQAVCAAVWTGLMYLRYCVGTAAVPFLYLESPGCSPFRAVRQSLQLLGSCQGMFWGILLRYLPLMLPVVTIPFLLPYLMTNCILLIQIRIREWTQQQEETIHARTVFSRKAPGTLQASELSAS